MPLIVRKSAVLAALLVIGLLGTPARAGLVITVQEDAGPVNTVVNVAGSPTADLAGAVVTFNTTDYKIQILSGEADQMGSLAELLSSTTSVTNKTGASGHV